MAIFSIESGLFLGMSHTGAVTIEGENTVELNDTEVNTLVQLIREKGTTSVEALGLETSHPALYDKLDEAYRSMAVDAEETYWLWEGYNSGYFEYDQYELMDYCKENCGFKFEYDEADYLDDDEFMEDLFNDDEMEAFEDWLGGYLDSLSDDEAKVFFYEHMNASVDLDMVDYTVKIPPAIVKMAK